MALKFLLVDDDPHSFELIRFFLKDKDVELTYCSSGKEGLSELREQRFDLLLLDLEMPEVDGFSVLKTISNDDSVGSLPILILTSHSDVDNVQKAINFSVDGYLIKPPTKQNLLNKISKVLSSYKTKQGAAENPFIICEVRSKDNTLQLPLKMSGIDMDYLYLQGTRKIAPGSIVKGLDFPQLKEIDLDLKKLSVEKSEERGESRYFHSLSLSHCSRDEKMKILNWVIQLPD
jgi:DNA-binding response OmpR family regulator